MLLYMRSPKQIIHLRNSLDFEEINQPVYRVADDVTSKEVSDIFEDNGPVYRSKKACSLDHVARFGALSWPYDTVRQ